MSQEQPHPNQHEAKVSAMHALFVTNNLICLCETIKGSDYLSGHAYHTLILLPGLCLKYVLYWKMPVCFPVTSCGQGWLFYRSCGSHSSWKSFRELQFSAAISNKNFHRQKNPGAALLILVDIYFILSSRV